MDEDMDLVLGGDGDVTKPVPASSPIAFLTQLPRGFPVTPFREFTAPRSSQEKF